MPDRLSDQAWRKIVAVGATSRGVRGKVFRMNVRTARALAVEKQLTTITPITVYSVPVEIVRTMRDGEIRLEQR